MENIFGLTTCVAIVVIAYLVGIVSGLAATGVNQVFKQLRDN